MLGGCQLHIIKPCVRCNLTTIDPTKGEFRSSKEPLKCTPSLGISWSTCVNTRILIRRLNNETVEPIKTDTHYNGTPGNTKRSNSTSSGGKIIVCKPIVRELRVLLSPCLPSNNFCYFSVGRNGLLDV